VAAPAPSRPPPATQASEPIRTSPSSTASSTPSAPTTIARAAPAPSPAVAAPSAPAGPPSERQTASAAQVKAAGTGKFVWPVKGRVLSGFGPKPDGQRNDGINIAAPMNASVHAAASGEVIYAGDVLREYGNLVLIQHADGFVTAYGHLAKMNVKMKDKVSQDQEIGQVGDSGGVTQPQLHFETRYARTPADSPAPPVDPMLVLPNP
jgi:murein DD-endopeptidase MepM/ murein hydrolase activator NlpD